MTNQLDALLEALEDALEEAEMPLWQPDLTELVLPGVQDILSETEGEDRQGRRTADEPEASADRSVPDRRQALSRPQGFQETQEKHIGMSGQSSGSGQERSPEVAPEIVPGSVSETARKLASERIPQSSSPALLEQLRHLEDSRAGAEALGRSQAAGSSLSPRSGAGQGGSGISYDPATLGDFPLAAAAAAAQEEDRARAVDRAFQRDSRRYDRGFSLY